MVNANASTIKIRNLAHLLQQLDELGQPISSADSDDVRLSEADTERHLYGSSVSSSNCRSMGNQQGLSTQVSTSSSQQYDQRGHRVCPRHPVSTTISLDSQLVEQDLAYLLGTESQLYRRPRVNSRVPQLAQPIERFVLDQYLLQCLIVCIIRNARHIVTNDQVGNLLNPYQTPTSSYFATLPPLSPSTTTSTTTSTAREGHEDEAEEYDFEENGSAFDSDLNADLNSCSGHNGSQQSGCLLTRSASEEALPVRFFATLADLNCILRYKNCFVVHRHTLGIALITKPLILLFCFFLS